CPAYRRAELPLQDGRDGVGVTIWGGRQVGDHGHSGRTPAHRIEPSPQHAACRLHQRRVEGRSYVEGQDAPGAALLEPRIRLLEPGQSAADDGLGWRVVI